MNRHRLAALVLFASAMVSCANNANKKSNSSSNGVLFAPTEKETSLSSEEREAAIAEKRAEIASMDVCTELSSSSIRMTILPPALSGDIDEKICESIVSKLLTISTANGISGVNGSSIIAFAAAMDQTGRSVTGSAPQKMTVKYSVTYYVMNTDSGDVYGSCQQEVTGVGSSFYEATANAVNSISSNQNLQKMLSESSERVILWYNDNYQQIINDAKYSQSKNEYLQAISILRSIPEAAHIASSAAAKLLPEMIDRFQRQVAGEQLVLMKDAIAASGAEYSPKVAAHLYMLPVGSAEAKEGNDLYQKYMSQIDAERLRKISVEERREMEQLELRKLEMKYETEAAIAYYNSRTRTPKSSSSLKPFLNGVSAMSIVGNILSRALFVF